jgi:alpha-glucosidase
VYPGKDCTGTLYQDDGHTFAYKRGVYLRQAFTCLQEPASVVVDFGAREGSYPPWWKSIEVVVYDWPSAGAQARLVGSQAELKTSYDAAAHALHVTIPDVARSGSLRLEPGR